MYLSLAVIFLTGIIAYAWSARGVFSSFLHMLCVIIAGALAFAFWEPIAVGMMSGASSPTLLDLGWGLSLGLPFAVILVILRVACDKLIPFNLDFDTPVNVVGGLLFGAVSGIITCGILLLSVGYTRLENKILEFQPITYEPSGSLVRSDSLWLPADKLTVSFYSALSNATLLPPNPNATLGRLRPNMADEHWLMRMNFDEGKSRNTIHPDAFEVLASYQLSADKDPGSVLGDSFDAARKQTISTIDGSQVNAASTDVLGYVVRFTAGARESSGRVVVGPGQVRLIIQTDPNNPYQTVGVQPFAMISQATGDKPILGRWRFDAPNVFISSVGGRDDAPMAFEFPVPKGAIPVALYVKGMRHDVSAMAPAFKFTSIAARDGAITSGTITPSTNLAKIDRSQAVRVRIDPASQDTPIRQGVRLPFNAMLQKDIVKDLELNGAREISGGQLSKFSKDEVNGFGTDPALQVRGFATSEDTSIVQVTVDSTNAQWGFLSTVAAGASGKPVLIDTNGVPYSPVGYVYKQRDETWVYYNPGAPLQSMTDKDLPTLSRSQPDQKLVLVFRVSKNVKIKEFAIGEKVIAEFAPPVEVK